MSMNDKGPSTGDESFSDRTDSSTSTSSSNPAGSSDTPKGAGSGSSPSSSKGSIGPNIKKGVTDKALNAAMNSAPEGVQETAQTAKKVAETSAKAAHAAQATAQGASAAASALSNPVTWIVAGVAFVLALVMVGTIATTQTIGQNENANGCFGIGGSAADNGSVSSSGNGVLASKGIPTKAIPWVNNASKNSKLGIPPAFFAYIMDRESDFSPTVFSNDSNGGTWGLFQINAEEWHRITGGSWGSPDIKDPMIHTQYGAKYFDQRLLGIRAMRKAHPTAAYTTQLTELEDLMIAHNAGEGNLQKYPSLPDVTRSYLAEYKKKFPLYGGGSANGASAGPVADSTTGGSCARNSGDEGNVDTSTEIGLAISMSYPTTAQSKVSSGDPYGTSLAKPEYKAAKAKAMKEAGPDGMPTLYASCDRFVATVIKLTVDKNIPWGPTGTQAAYLASSPKWKQYTTKSQAKPGDIWITKSDGHVMLYIGKVKGVDSTASASYMDRVAAIGPASYLSENLVDTSGRPYFGYHFVG